MAPRKFDVLKTNICPRSETSWANMPVLRTSNFQGTAIREILFRDINTLLSLSFTTKFSSSRQFKSHVQLFSINYQSIVPQQKHSCCLNSVSPRTNTIASRYQFKPIRIEENLMVNYNLFYSPPLNFLRFVWFKLIT